MNIEDLISQYIDGDLPSDAEAEMHHRLAVSPEARRLFRAQIALRGLARNPKVLHTPASELRAKLFERLEREEGMKPQAPLPAPPVHAAEMARPVPSPTASGDARRRRRGIVWLLPTAVAAIVAVAVIWKPGQPLARPDGTAIADGSVRSSTGYGTAEPPALGSTGASSDAAVQRDIPVREAPPQAAMKAAPSSQSASGGASAPRPSSVSRGTASGDGQSSRSHLGADRMAFAPKAMEDAAFGTTADDGAREDSHTIAMAEVNSARPVPPPSESAPDLDLRSPVVTKPLKATAEFGKKFPEPDVHMMGGGKPERHSEGGNGGGAKSQSADEANGAHLLATAPSGMSAPQSPMGNASSVPMGDTVGIRVEKHAQVPPQAFSTSRPEDEGDGNEVARSGPRWVITVHQGSFASAGGGVDLDMGLRGGIEFDRGRQMVFAVIGLDGYRRTVADSVTEVVVGGVASAPGAAPQTLRERSYEVAAGAGYRYTVRLSSNWGIGAGGWSTVSAHYLRAGLEAPVTFTPIRWLRLEVLPSMRYSRVHSGAALTGERRVLSSGDEETIQRVTTPDGDGAVDIGIGFGASLVW